MALSAIVQLASAAAPTIAILVSHHVATKDRGRIETKVDETSASVNGHAAAMEAKLDASTAENTQLQVDAAELRAPPVA